MATDEKSGTDSKRNPAATQSGMGVAYFLATIGAAVYWVQQANGVGQIVVALLKSLVWPSFLVYELLKLTAA